MATAAKKHGARSKAERKWQHLYDRRWQRARAWFLKQHPLCVRCMEQGLVEAARVVDHVIDHKGNHELFWRQSNWQPLCKGCHDRKTGLRSR